MSQTVLMSSTQDRATRLPPYPRLLWTLIGLSAIPLWALWPLLAVLSSDRIPAFEFLAITHAVGAVTLFAVSSGRRPAVRQIGVNILPAIMVAVGILGSNVFFVYA